MKTHFAKSGENKKGKLKWLEITASETQSWHERCIGIMVFNSKTFW